MFFLTSVTFLSMRVKEANLSESSFDQFFSAFKNLLNKNNVIILLMLVGIYKISDIVLGPMAAALYVEVGLDNAEYLQKKSYFNFIATFVGSGLALWTIKKFQIEMTMFLGALLVVSTNMCFSYLTSSELLSQELFPLLDRPPLAVRKQSLLFFPNRNRAPHTGAGGQRRQD